MSSTLIADHAFLPDRHSSALVDRAGSVEWLCPHPLRQPVCEVVDRGAGFDDPCLATSHPGPAWAPASGSPGS